MEPNKTNKMKMVYTIAERENGKSYWTRIGVGFVNQDGSINLKLDAIPMHGQQIQVREWEPYDPTRSSGPNGPARAQAPRPFREPPPLPREPDNGPLVDQIGFGGLT